MSCPLHTCRQRLLVERPEFKTLDFSQHSTGEWFAAIVGWFTNYYNRFIAKGLPTTVDGHVSKSAPSTTDKRVVDKALRSLAIFSGDVSPREFYAQENATLLKERAEEILQARNDNLPKGAARNMALADLWDGLTDSEKNDWKDRAHALSGDVSRNREEFPLLMTDAIQSICDRGRLGSVVMALHFAYRDDQGGLECGCLYAGTDVNTGARINAQMMDHEEWHSQWRQYSNEIVPHPPPPRTTLIKRRDDGTPLFPDIDTKMSSPGQVAIGVEDYIAALWDKASPATKRNKVPWKLIAEDPEMFYDGDTFKLPCRLRPASEMVEDLGHMYMLVAYLQDRQKRGVPFKFYQQNEHESGSSEDELDFDSAVNMKATTRKKSPLPHRLAEQPHTIQPVNKATDKAATPLTAETSKAAHPASTVPPPPTADTLISPAPEASHADQLNQTTNQLPKPLTTETSEVAPTTSVVTSTVSLPPTADTFISPAPEASHADQLNKATDQLPTPSTAETSKVAPTTSANVRPEPPAALPTEAPTATTLTVGNKPGAARTVKKRKRAVGSEPRPPKKLRPREKPQVAEPTLAKPEKKRRKVKANSWRLTKTGREIPYYEKSDYESEQEGAGPSKSNEELLTLVPANSTDGRSVEISTLNAK
ncbi:hypothetical protein HYPSUDRAFT_208911 [Hypholoma sublateritium FD-334 SS-4]|uniref:Uncharacterized protein n=1 Tax=Hypholoma sublateritium (strain FD-334 SS-4) TaxID=945553 RepID=A0A0D2P0N2_HYPSF|nr:hypothetical protein HYPSUDRAFT_208911 [Hypholoma sublateritium FD-334 SS-4]